MNYLDQLPPSAVGLKLHRFEAGGRLLACEAIRFVGGLHALETTLRRAAVSGRVEIGGEIADHFADVIDDEQTILETIALDRKSYSALKNKWMRCKMEPRP